MGHVEEGVIVESSNRGASAAEQARDSTMQSWSLSLVKAAGLRAYDSPESNRIEFRERQRPQATSLSSREISQAFAMAFCSPRRTQKVRRLPQAMHTGTRPMMRPSNGASWRLSSLGIAAPLPYYRPAMHIFRHKFQILEECRVVQPDSHSSVVSETFRVPW